MEQETIEELDYSISWHYIVTKMATEYDITTENTTQYSYYRLDQMIYSIWENHCKEVEEKWRNIK